MSHSQLEMVRERLQRLRATWVQEVILPAPATEPGETSISRMEAPGEGALPQGPHFAMRLLADMTVAAAAAPVEARPRLSVVEPPRARFKEPPKAAVVAPAVVAEPVVAPRAAPQRPAVRPVASPAVRELGDLALERSPRGPLALAWVGIDGGADPSGILGELAASLGDATGGEALLIDADFRTQSLSRRWGLSGAEGLAEALTGRRRMGDFVCPTAQEGLSVLGAGANCEPSADWRDERAWRTLFGELRPLYSITLVDAGVLGPLHVRTLAAACDGAWLAAELDATPRRRIQEALAELGDWGARVLGVALTGV